MKYDPKTMFFHFTSNTLRDGSPIPPKNEWLIFDRAPKLCYRGFHASRHPFDAFQYAPGNNLHLVQMGTIWEEQGDKVVSNCRLILDSHNVEDLLRQCARKWALDVIDLWNAPLIVREYLQTGDISKQDAAWE